MASKYLIFIRRLTTSSSWRQSYLSTNYKSKDIWEQRFNCKLLGSDDTIIKTINQKIISNNDLNNLELDIFINIATPSTEEIAQLHESLKSLVSIRKSLYAHTLLPSTTHALCRLFMYSERLKTLIMVLEDRVKYGIFPDFYSMNLLLDMAIDKEDFATAARLAALVMFQEEFGVNKITDYLSLLAISKYIEKKGDFSDWQKIDAQNDDILNFSSETEDSEELLNKQNTDTKEEIQKEQEEEEEEEVEYVRIPFLRNPYNDNHFDITEPRVICGKTLSMISLSLKDSSDSKLANQADFLGLVLQCSWQEALKKLEELGSDIDNCVKSIARFYVDNSNNPSESDEKLISKLKSSLGDIIENDESVFSKLVESKCSNLNELENKDIDELKSNLVEWSNLREGILRKKDERIAREKLIEQVRAKKEELKLKEQYLYFYDNLKKYKVTRIEYN